MHPFDTPTTDVVEQRAKLTAAIEQLAWTVGRETLELEPDAEPRSDLPDADLRQLWLAALTSLLAIRDSAEQLSASAALSAAQRGADYPAIGEAAGMTRQGARRKWPGLAGLAGHRQRKLTWWNTRGDQFIECFRTILAMAERQPGLPWLANLHTRLAELEQASPAQRLDALDMMLVDAHAAALNASPPSDSTTGRPIGLLAALTADAYAYAATNGHSLLITRDAKACGTHDCTRDAVVELLSPDSGHQTLPAGRQHAVEALRHTANRIVTAYQPDVALSVFAETHGNRLM
ncbi:hypothetical protein F0L68_35705 [Solihabitans fulvus]|uniref:Uncharacterized protein n=1 Tax=Solihabitans fulvus TaxID=1892852 RepID=A0A5B2WPF9_9PSEU|nr:hypothetical protein [Solihabitans fulvus]KAA2252396.1 hypothetical protein F0L68_35705 [Solihabitans fulvus]